VQVRREKTINSKVLFILKPKQKDPVVQTGSLKSLFPLQVTIASPH
jgi:hypothetical protein